MPGYSVNQQDVALMPHQPEKDTFTVSCESSLVVPHPFTKLQVYDQLKRLRGENYVITRSRLDEDARRVEFLSVSSGRSGDAQSDSAREGETPVVTWMTTDGKFASLFNGTARKGNVADPTLRSGADLVRGLEADNGPPSELSKLSLEGTYLLLHPCRIEVEVASGGSRERGDLGDNRSDHSGPNTPVWFEGFAVSANTVFQLKKDGPFLISSRRGYDDEGRLRHHLVSVSPGTESS